MIISSSLWNRKHPADKFFSIIPMEAKLMMVLSVDPICKFHFINNDGQLAD